MRIPKTVRKGIISIVVIVLLFLVAGTLYTLFAGQSTSPKTAAPKAATTKPLVAKPTPPAANAPVSVSVSSLFSPVVAGANSSLTIKTLPGATCEVSVVYNGVPSKDSGLAPKAADPYGSINWSWTVESTVPAGTWPIKVSCAYHGRSAVVQASLQVVKP